MNQNEFSHTVAASKIGASSTTVEFSANERQRALLAKRYGIMSVDALEGVAHLQRETDGMTIAVTGRLKADVTQACVTTLEPVKDHIEEDFQGWFLDESQATSFQRAKKRKDEVEGSEILPPEESELPVPAEQEEPEPIVGGLVDIGELAAQYLSLALNPYPHSEKALEKGPMGDEATLEKPNPFAVLKDLKK